MIFFPTAIAKTGASAGVWNTVSLASDIPWWARCAAFYVAAGARTPGSAWSNGRPGWVICETDASRNVELYGNAVNYLVGYGPPSHFTTHSSVDITPAGTTGWQTVDISSSVPSGNTLALVQVSHGFSGGSRAVGARHPSETADTSESHYDSSLPGWFLCGISATRTIALYKASSDVFYYLLGSLISESFAAIAPGNAVTVPNAAWTDFIDGTAGTGGLFASSLLASTVIRGGRYNGDSAVISNSYVHWIAAGYDSAKTCELYQDSGAGVTMYRIGRFLNNYFVKDLSESITLADAVTNTPTSGAAGTLYPQGKVGKMYQVKGELKR